MPQDVALARRIRGDKYQYLIFHPQHSSQSIVVMSRLLTRNSVFYYLVAFHFIRTGQCAQRYNSIAKMNTRLCIKAGKHTGRPVEALCLEDGCREDCLLCFYCFFETHSLHQVAYLHPELEGPISKLYQQTITASDANDSRERLEANFTNITTGCQQLARKAKSRLQEIQARLTPQIEAIRTSFSTSSINDMLRDLTSNQPISPEKVNKYIRILRFYNKNSRFDIDKLEENSKVAWETLNSLFQETKNKLDLIFADLEKLAAGMDLIKGFQLLPPQSEEREPEVILQQKIAEDMEILKERQAEQVEREMVEEVEMAQDAMKPQKVSEDQMKVPQNQLTLQAAALAGSIHEEQPIEAEPEKPQQALKQQKEQGEILVERPSANSSPNAIEEEREDIEERQKVIDKFKSKDGSKMVIKKATPSLQLMEQTWANDINWQPKSLVPSEKADRTLRKTQASKVEAVFISAVCPKELNRMLQRVEAESVKSLVIRCDTRLDILDAESVSFIIRMKKLTSLRVYYARNMPEWMAIDLLQNLRDLQELVLAEFGHLTPRVVDVIKAYNINLTRICFAGDLRSLRSSEETLEFLPDIVEGIRPEELWQSLADSALILSTLELQNPTNQTYWINYMRNCGQSLREISIVQTEPHVQDYTELMRAVGKFCQGLECLRVEMLEFQEDSLIEIIKNNKDLQVFAVSECHCITMRTYRALFKHAPNLRALSISLDDKFTGKFAQAAKHLEVLILRGCYAVIENEFCGLLASFRHLKCLSVNYAEGWLNRNAIWQISKMKSLQALNISSNPECLHPFNLKCLKLRSLICSNNGISYTAFTDHSFTASIEKLSISGLSTKNGKEVLDLDLIRFFFPKLTHLKAVDYEKLSCDPNKFDEHKYLVSLVVGGFTKEEDIESMRLYCSRRRISFLHIMV